MKKIIIVEDDINLRKELKQLLETSGYEVFLIENFKNIQEKILQENADLVLLDINLPNVNGEIVLKELRKQSAIPVIMVTSRTSEVDEVLSLSYGADDYVTKPYNPTLLLLRIGAVLKRYDSTTVADELYYKDVKVNVAKGTLQRKEQEVSLTKNEMLIFLLLLENQNKIVSRNVIMTNLWDNDEFLNDNALTVNISRLRGKLKELGYEDVIETKKKQGYILI